VTGKLLLIFALAANSAGVLATETCDPDAGGKAKKVQMTTVFLNDGLHKVGDYHGTIKAENPTKSCTWKSMIRDSKTGKFSIQDRGTEKNRLEPLGDATHFETYNCGKWVKVS
jgi:hypothetical protein